MTRDLKQIISQMTLEEKTSILGGMDMWHTQNIPRLNIPNIMVTDGPHGLRKQSTEQAESQTLIANESVCFPTACATSCTFNTDLLYKMGETLGDEAASENVGVLLGPALNIKRSPLCGRNFEYFSEDPYLSTKMTAAMVKGVQSKGVGACLKHFAANNCETRRLTIDERIDERTLREIYLASFEGAVREADPWAMMCSYNKINGVFSADNELLLQTVLRDDWGFNGFVMSDWGATNERVLDVKAGLELQMPGPSTYNCGLVAKAVREGKFDEKLVDRAVERVLGIVFKAHDQKQKGCFDLTAHHQIARQICEEAPVLLKNENKTLPLRKEQKIAFIGEFAEKPRYQGGGSSLITSFKIESALENVKAYCQVSYAQGFQTETDEIDTKLITEAINVAKAAEVVVIFAGLPDAFETEGKDRQHIDLPNCQNHLINEILKVNKNVVIVLHNGSPVAMPWINDVKAVLEAYLGGEAIGAVVDDILFGNVNPSGRLAETFPLRLEDTPCFLDFPGYDDYVEYREGVFVGYRYYESKKAPILFPFGYGLSYTTFEYSSLKINKIQEEEYEVSVDVKNTGSVSGKEVVQLYVSDKTRSGTRPIRELRGFTKISLNPGETKTASIKIGKRAFQWWNPKCNGWYAKSGEYEIQIGKSAREIVLSQSIQLKSSSEIPFVAHINCIFSDLWNHPVTKPIIDALVDKYPREKALIFSEDPELEFMRNNLKFSPMRSIPMFFPFEKDTVELVIEECNKALQAAAK